MTPGPSPMTSVFLNLTENIFMGWGSVYSRGTGASIAEAANQSWYSEINNVDAAWKCVTGEPTCGHYSQQVWATTTKIGCSITKNCDKDGGVIVYCEYDPAGNYRGQSPY